MVEISLLKNTIQEYAWGSATDIPELLGQANPDHKPQAELWMGAHPKAPSQILINNRWVSLKEVIRTHPVDMLGNKAAQTYQNQLPYLFKVLAAGKPLSIQAHPSAEQARQGFARENRLNIPLDADNRNYKDDHHKPECICALTPFWALNGFRPIDQIVSYFSLLCAETLDREIKNLDENRNEKGLKQFFKTLLSLGEDRKIKTISTALEIAKKGGDNEPLYKWIEKLYDAYKNDIGILSPALLNLVCLKPGEAMFLPSGQLHAYLSGLGIELMANSDNVLRGGLTPKHVDVPEMLDVLNFKPTEIELLAPAYLHETEAVYHAPAKEFVLSVIHVEKDLPHISSEDGRSIEILLCTEGAVQVQPLASGSRPVHVKKGASVVIPAAAAQYRIEGRGTLYKAGVP